MGWKCTSLLHLGSCGKYWGKSKAWNMTVDGCKKNTPMSAKKWSSSETLVLTDLQPVVPMEFQRCVIKTFYFFSLCHLCGTVTVISFPASNNIFPFFFQKIIVIVLLCMRIRSCLCQENPGRCQLCSSLWSCWSLSSVTCTVSKKQLAA